MHRPVGAPLLGELAGAVERVDDPDPVGLEATRVVDRLLREHAVAFVVLAQELEQPAVREHVAGVAERPTLPLVGCRSLAQLQQQLARLGGVPCRVVAVPHGGHSGRDGRPTCLAARAGFISPSHRRGALTVPPKTTLQQEEPCDAP